ncbi:ABC transporter substrate-binding protein [Nocardiopsis synnemataformans]|uniref:ABC transporter substrate-binding protein n=1 Tax=Nocardiopsis synnemataformans TaxID=61305 RepID=UPI003EBBB782
MELTLERRGIARTLPAAIGCVLVLSACSGASGASDDGVITFAVADFENDALDPAMETNTGMRTTKFLMWDSLLEIGSEGELVPGLAEEWEISEDGTSWNFVLREGVTFHNGEALTADDVKFSLDRMRHENAATGDAAFARDVIESVEVVGDHEVVVNTNGVQTSLPYLVSSHQSTIGVVMPQDYLLEEGGETFEEQRELLERAPVGSGPFRFVERSHGDSMVFESLDEHWRATPEIERVEFLRVSEEATQISMLQSGEVDIINVSPEQAGLLEETGFELRSVPQASEIGFFFPGLWRDGMEDMPAGDVRVRQALSLAINRQAIIDSVLAGYGNLKETPWNTTGATADIDAADWESWAQRANEYDPQRARDLLAEAGYADGFGIRVFTFPRPGVPALPQISEIVAAQWAEIGVDAEIVPTDYNSYRPHWVGQAPDDTYNLGDANPFGTAPRFDPIGAFAAYVTREGGAAQLTSEPEVDELVEQAANTIDDAERQALVEQAYRLFVEEWAVLEIAIVDSVFAVNGDEVGEWRVIPSYPFLGRTFETISLP